MRRKSTSPRSSSTCSALSRPSSATTSLDRLLGADDRDEVAREQLDVVVGHEQQLAALDPAERDGVPAARLHLAERAEAGVLDERRPHDDLDPRPRVAPATAGAA